MEEEEKQTTDLYDKLMAVRKDLGYLEGVMRQTAHGGGVRLPATAMQSMRQAQMQLGQIADHARRLQDDYTAFRDLARTSALVNSSLEIDEVLNEVMDTVIALTDAERGYLMLVQADTGELAFKVARNMDRESLEETDFAVSRSIVHQVAESGDPVLTTDAASDPRFSSQASVMGYNLRSIICVPLMVREKVIGAVYVDNRAVRGIFGESHLTLLKAFANQAGIAISNARQFGQVKADLEEAKREVAELRIVIDEAQRQAQVDQITDSAFFRDLKEQVSRYRRSQQDEEGGEEA